jgi:hypothetical protein
MRRQSQKTCRNGGCFNRSTNGAGTSGPQAGPYVHAIFVVDPRREVNFYPSAEIVVRRSRKEKRAFGFLHARFPLDFRSTPFIMARIWMMFTRPIRADVFPSDESQCASHRGGKI